MKLLIVVDMQNDFVSGKLGFPEAETIVPKIKDKILEYRKNNDDIFFTRDTHYEDVYLKSREGRHLPIPHCYEHTEGWMIVSELAPRKLEIYNKNTFGLNIIDIRDMHDDSFYGDLDYYDSIEIVGVVTNLCVLSVAITIQANILHPDIIIDASCCAAPDKNMHNKALDIMEGLHMKVINR